MRVEFTPDAGGHYLSQYSIALAPDLRCPFFVGCRVLGLGILANIESHRLISPDERAVARFLLVPSFACKQQVYLARPSRP